MIQAFVNGQLSEADHDLMAHHIATCEQCAAAVAVERAVHGELAKLLAQSDALSLPSPVADPADLSVPPVPELQLDFVLDRTSEVVGLLLPREPVREVALDQLPPAPAHSERRSERRGADADAAVGPEGWAHPGDTPRVGYADDSEVAAATAAGIADSVAHAAAALASSSPWVPLEEPASAIEDLTPIEEAARAGIDDVAVVEDAPALIADMPVADEPEDAFAAVTSLAEETEAALVGSEAGRQKPWMRLWGAAAAVLVVGLASAYAAGQLRFAGGTGVPPAAARQLEPVADADVEWRMTSSVLMPVLDSAVYNRVIDVTPAADSLADVVDTSGVLAQGARTETPLSASTVRSRRTPSERRAGVAELLPQIVSDPPDADPPPVPSPAGEALPEVVRGNAPARTRTRGSAVVISGVPDVPRLLRTTTHRPGPDVAYVLREYDASAAEPAPRAGVNEFRWSDATGSRLYVLSGPVAVSELRAYARQLRRR